jgi:uncharacterized protein YegP (UPF0339 family)
MHYEHYEDSKGEWRWRPKASNGRVIAGSSEGYSSESECLVELRLIIASVKPREHSCVRLKVAPGRINRALRFPTTLSRCV